MSYDLVDCCGVCFSPVDPSAVQYWTGSAVYAFVRRDVFGGRRYLYFGECEDMSTRLGPRHEKWADAIALGMNEVHLHLSAKTRTERLDVEQRLRSSIPTPLNEQNSLMQMIGLLGTFEPDPAPYSYPAPFGFAPPSPRDGLINALAALPASYENGLDRLPPLYKNALAPAPEQEPVNHLLAALLRR